MKLSTAKLMNFFPPVGVGEQNTQILNLLTHLNFSPPSCLRVSMLSRLRNWKGSWTLLEQPGPNRTKLSEILAISDLWGPFQRP